jgi:hypothetical protein
MQDRALCHLKSGISKDWIPTLVARWKYVLTMRELSEGLVGILVHRACVPFGLCQET